MEIQQNKYRFSWEGIGPIILCGWWRERKTVNYGGGGSGLDGEEGDGSQY